jgi:hypothetical protein
MDYGQILQMFGNAGNTNLGLMRQEMSQPTPFQAVQSSFSNVMRQKMMADELERKHANEDREFGLKEKIGLGNLAAQDRRLGQEDRSLGQKDTQIQMEGDYKNWQKSHGDADLAFRKEEAARNEGHRRRQLDLEALRIDNQEQNHAASMALGWANFNLSSKAKEEAAKGRTWQEQLDLLKLADEIGGEYDKLSDESKSKVSRTDYINQRVNAIKSVLPNNPVAQGFAGAPTPFAPAAPGGKKFKGPPGKPPTQVSEDGGVTWKPFVPGSL